MDIPQLSPDAEKDSEVEDPEQPEEVDGDLVGKRERFKALNQTLIRRARVLRLYEKSMVCTNTCPKTTSSLLPC